MLAVRWWQPFASSAAGTSSWTEGLSDIVWPISILTTIKKHRASEHLWLHLIASFRVRAKLSRTRTSASELDVSCHVMIAQVETAEARLGQAAT